MVTEVIDVYEVTDSEDKITVNDAPDLVSVVDAPDGMVVVTDTTDNYVVTDHTDATTVSERIDSYEVTDAPIVNLITINRPVALARTVLETGEDIAIYKVVVNINGLGFLADHTNSTHSGSVLGISDETIPTGFPQSIITAGEVTNGLWTLSSGDPVYLGTLGNITQVIPTGGFLLKLGVAIDTDTISLDIKMPIHLH